MEVKHVHLKCIYSMLMKYVHYISFFCILQFVGYVGIILKRSGFAYVYYIFEQCYFHHGTAKFTILCKVAISHFIKIFLANLSSATIISYK